MFATRQLTGDVCGPRQATRPTPEPAALAGPRFRGEYYLLIRGQPLPTPPSLMDILAGPIWWAASQSGEERVGRREDQVRLFR
ncbi:hypothetical protein BHE74_00023682 [Ensete ventricosum]|nr:hypothetical protein BHE74_00023682 [Ensete ventricosum]